MQQLQAERDALLKPLATVTGIVERRHTLPILSNVLIRNENGTLTFTGTDLEIQIASQQSSGFSGDEFALTVAAKKISDILRSLPDKVVVTLEEADGRLTVKAGKSRFNLQSLPADDFPLLTQSHDAQAGFVADQNDFSGQVRQTVDQGAGCIIKQGTINGLPGLGLLRRLTREHCDELISIPMAGAVSSLNVSVATGVCLFEAVRQRKAQ